MLYEQAVVVKNEVLGPGHFLLELALPGLEEGITAGQFVNLRCTEDGKHDLLRPFSILGITQDRSALLVYAKALGRLSARLGNMPAGAKLDCLYPLGVEFTWQAEWRRVALVGGGVGLAPLLFLAEQLLERDSTLQVTGFFGGNTESDLVPSLLARYKFPMELATMDGSRGYHGTVVAAFAPRVTEYDAVYTCGPNPMMAALQEVVPPATPAFASLEEYMACGVGACLGCVARIERSGVIYNLPVCKDGPVFNLHEVRFA